MNVVRLGNRLGGGALAEEYFSTVGIQRLRFGHADEPTAPVMYRK
jgi:hypothetical protein